MHVQSLLQEVPGQRIFFAWLQVRFVAAQEVAFAREEGLPIIDVRPAKEYESG